MKNIENLELTLSIGALVATLLGTCNLIFTTAVGLAVGEILLALLFALRVKEAYEENNKKILWVNILAFVAALVIVFCLI